MEKNEELSDITVPSYGGPHNDRSIRITHLSEDEHEKMLGAFKSKEGTYWVRIRNGRLESRPHFIELPSPVYDDEMLPFWRKPTQKEVKLSLKKYKRIPFKEENDEELHLMASIFIRSLCGYYYSPENYKFNAEKLTSFGFECLRSRRGDDGKFWEIWQLPFLDAARGDLKKRIHKVKDDSKRLKIALNFLARTVSFGSLDVSVQRMAMPTPD